MLIQRTDYFNIPKVHHIPLSYYPVWIWLFRILKIITVSENICIPWTWVALEEKVSEPTESVHSGMYLNNDRGKVFFFVRKMQQFNSTVYYAKLYLISQSNKNSEQPLKISLCILKETRLKFHYPKQTRRFKIKNHYTYNSVV